MPFALWSVWVGVLLSATTLAGDLDKAFPPISTGTGQVVASDITAMDITYDLDVASARVTGIATFKLVTQDRGFPAFDLIPSPTHVTLNGQSVSAPEISAGGTTRLRYLNKVVDPGVEQIVEMEWSLTSATFGSGGVRLGFFMGDLSDRNFFEKYAPTNFEYDQYPTNMTIHVRNASQNHVVYTNARTTELGNNSWSLEFPAYFTTSSYYLHIAPKGYYDERRFDLQLSQSTVPVVVYGSSVSSAESSTRSILKELESTYGAFGHERLVVYVTPSGGGMEYCGATMTSMGALGHELTHSWFARGVMPANGASAWFDEAIASWRDNGYPRYTSSPGQQNLGNFSPYRRHTTQLAYSGGMQLIGHLDYVVGGMKSMLRQFFAEKKHQTINNAIFLDYLEKKSGKNLKALFDESVFNNFMEGEEPDHQHDSPFHPRKYTEEELIRFQ